MRVFWPAGLALALAIAAVLLVPASPARRVSNLDLTNSELSDTFLVLSRWQTGRCRVVNRRDSTMRRFDAQQPGRNWDCLRIPGRHGGASADTWLVRSKRRGEGTVFFVPVYDVGDWTYPFLYRFVSEHNKELNLPVVEWTQLFVGRLYQGFYLRVGLPFDPPQKAGGSGILRELLTVRDGHLTVVDTRFDDSRRLYAAATEAGAFPRLREPPPQLAWLARRCPTTETTFLMSNVPPYELSLLPLPISLLDLYRAKERHPPVSFQDQRYSQWTRAPWRSEPDIALPFLDTELAPLVSGYQQYSRAFRRALQADAELHQSQAHLPSLLRTRQAGLAGLKVDLSEL